MFEFYEFEYRGDGCDDEFDEFEHAYDRAYVGIGTKTGTATGASTGDGLRRRAPNPIPAADSWQWWLRRSASPDADAEASGNVDVQTRGLRFDPELNVWMNDGLAEGVEKDCYGRRRRDKNGSVRLRRSASPEADVQCRDLQFDPESNLWLNDGLAEGDEGVEKDRYGRRRRDESTGRFARCEGFEESSGV